MKKIFALSAFLVAASLSQAQYSYFIKTTATLDGNNTVADSVYTTNAEVYRVGSLTSGGSQVQYLQSGNQKSVNVREQIGDSAWTFASFSFTLSTNSAMNNITVGGVAIIADTVPAAGSINATAGAIRDSINADTSSPDYIATASTSTVTITPISDSTATPNGRIVVVTSAGTVSPTNGILSGGFYRRNLLSVFPGSTLFEVTLGGKTNALNALWVSEMFGNTPVTMYYNKGPNQTFSINENRSDLETTVNALLD